MSRQADREPRVVFGFHAVLARLRADPSSVLEIYLDETRNDARARDLAALAERAKVHLMRVPTRRLDGFYGGGRHQGVVARIEIKKTSDSLDEILEGVERPLLLVLDGVTDPHNLGACLRVANGAGAHAVLAPKDRAVGVTPTVSKVASGAAESTPYLMVTNLARTLSELKERTIWVVGATSAPTRPLRSRPAGVDCLGARRRGGGYAPPDAGIVRPPRAHPHARGGREPQRVGVGGSLSVRISATSSRSG
jgi:23S rRNA (guanosine2251-2'-O)-methyltransferase